jgi:diguanylate cyclase (GGDEF)-like protein/PAS domain S-box-containing protein
VTDAAAATPSADLAAAELMVDVVARFDGALRHLYVNRAVERVTGRAASEFIGRTNRELGMPAHLVAQWEALLTQVFRSGRPQALQFAYAGPLGERVMHSQLTPEFDAAGQVCSVLTVARDLTEISQQAQSAMARVTTAVPLPHRPRADLQGLLDGRQAADHFRAIVESSDDAVISKTLDGIVTSWNPAAERIFGYSAAEMLGRPLLVLFPFDRTDEERFILELLMAGEQVDHFETVRLRKDGSAVHVSVTISPIRDRSGTIVGASKIARDITRAKAAEARLQVTANVFTFASEAIVIADPQGRIVDVNAAFTRITGYGRTQVLGQPYDLLRAAGDVSSGFWRIAGRMRRATQFQGEVWCRRADGEHFAALLTVSAVRDDQHRVQTFVALFADITALRQQSQRLEQAANYDALTHLPNRLLLSDRLRQAIAVTERQQQTLAVLYLDLDGFKAVNDQHGHAAGDQLLVQVAQRLRTAVREVDTLARIGGDEFVAVLVGLHDADECHRLVERMLRACAEPVLVHGASLQVSASIGVTLYPQDHCDADQLMRHADRAMYEAKQAGKNRYQFFDLAQDADFRQRDERVRRVQQALEGGELCLYYQPKVNLRERRVFGAEALLRWQHPTEGVLGPAMVLPHVDGHALGVAVGDWVVETAVAQLETWRSRGLELSVSVNVSASQFQRPDFVNKLAAALAGHPGVRPAMLELEIVETNAMEDVTLASHTMRACQSLGVRFAIDDFGTGYSSLTYLRRLPAETLKIDQSFVRDMLDDQEDLAIVQGVIGLAQAFGRQVIAEGVETLAHGQRLLELGCVQLQGYGIARPMPADQLPDWIREWEAAGGAPLGIKRP